MERIAGVGLLTNGAVNFVSASLLAVCGWAAAPAAFRPLGGWDLCALGGWLFFAYGVAWFIQTDSAKIDTRSIIQI